jgi:hypothetical protein
MPEPVKELIKIYHFYSWHYCYQNFITKHTLKNPTLLYILTDYTSSVHVKMQLIALPLLLYSRHTRRVLRHYHNYYILALLLDLCTLKILGFYIFYILFIILNIYITWLYIWCLRQPVMSIETSMARIVFCYIFILAWWWSPRWSKHVAF